MTEAPRLQLPSTGNSVWSSQDALGKILVIYFYPKDNTPGCTTESLGFANAYADFAKYGAEIVGISRDSIKSHENFKAKYSLPFPLLSDPEEIACAAYNVIKMKKMYGKEVRGIERSTFLIDPEGNIRREWRGVKVPGHVEEVLAAVRELNLV